MLTERCSIARTDTSDIQKYDPELIRGETRMKVVLSLIFSLVKSSQIAAAQSAGEVTFPPVVGDAGNLPVIQFVTYRMYSPGPNGADWEFIADIHFIAPQGNADSMHMQLVNAPYGYHVRPVPIHIPADAQKSGTYDSIHLVIGRCPQRDTATSEAYIVDANGNHSNSVRFSTHCSTNSLPTFDQQVQVGPTEYVNRPVPHTGTGAALRSYIEGWEKGEPPYGIMSSSAATSTQAQSAVIKKQLDDWGSLKSITFKAVDERGTDAYLVSFEHRETTWWVQQLDADGKLRGLSFAPSATDTTPLAAHKE